MPHLLEIRELLPKQPPFSWDILRLELCTIHEDLCETCGLCEGTESTLEITRALARLGKGDLTLRGTNKRKCRDTSASALCLLFRLFFDLCNGHVIRGLHGAVV